MKKIIRKWIWDFMGYQNGAPVNNADLNRILEGYGKQTIEQINSQLTDARGQLFEYFRQQEETNKEKIILVKLVK